MTVKYEITMPNATFLRNVDGEAVNLDWTDVAESVIPRILEVGAKVLLTNAFNGGGSKLTDSAKLGQMQKKLDAWKAGQFDVGGKGKTSFGQMKSAYVDIVVAATGASESAVGDSIKSVIKAAHGDDAPAHFSTFLAIRAEETAAESSGKDKVTVEEARITLESKLLAHYAKMEAERVKSVDKLDLSSIDI